MSTPKKAIILFSDGAEDDEISKWCTKEVASIPLYKRTVLSACKAGIREFIIFGCNSKDEVKDSLSADTRINAEFKWYDLETDVHWNELINREIKEDTDEHFLVIKANVLFSHNVLDYLSAPSPGNTIATIAIKDPAYLSPTDNTTSNDSVKSGIQDEVNGGIIAASHKIKDFIDPTNNGPSLHGLIQKLSNKNLLNTVEAKECLYEEVNSQASLVLAEKRLYQSLGSDSDSPILDRHVIRKVSGFISKLSIKTPVTPNQITVLSLILGLLSGLFFAFGGYTFNIIAGFLYFSSVVFDQCDGEIARLKYMQSDYGNILDIICDTVVNAAIVIGITYSIYMTSDSGFMIALGASAVVGISVSLLLTTYLEDQDDDKIPNGPKGFFDKLNNKDFFYVIILVCIAINQMIWFLLIMAIGTNIYWLTRKIFHRK